MSSLFRLGRSEDHQAYRTHLVYAGIKMAARATHFECNKQMKNLTQGISAFLGPTLIAITLSEALNLNIWTDAHPALVYFNGMILFVGGVITITNHGRWKNRRELLVTVSGYLLGLAGAYRMFFPLAPQLDPSLLTYSVIALLGALGFALSLSAFLKF